MTKTSMTKSPHRKLVIEASNEERTGSDYDLSYTGRYCGQNARLSQTQCTLQGQMSETGFCVKSTNTGYVLLPSSTFARCPYVGQPLKV